eukprot:6945403-Pyramimonas_sp.AAC.1
MGDSNEPEFCMGNCYESISDYIATASGFPKYTLASSEMFHDTVNAGVGLFIDDLLKLLALPPGATADEIRDVSNLDAECLDT